MRAWFEAWVRDVQGLEIDGELITTGSRLFDEAHDTLRLWVLTSLSGLSKLSVAEGKGWLSPSTSPPEQATTSSDSPAVSIESEAGAGLSDATGTTEAEPSSSPVEV